MSSDRNASIRESLEVDRRLFRLMAVGDQATDRVNREVNHTTMSGMLNL